jgi:putative methyltransferase (TIGR04325 family)
LLGASRVSDLQRTAERVYARLFNRARNARFTGAYPSYDAALAAIPPDFARGYDHDFIVDITTAEMCQILPADWPVLFWLKSILPGAQMLLDVGGHIGTKYRAFHRHLDLAGAHSDLAWVVYDLPAMVQAGRERARSEGLSQLSFIGDLEQATGTDVVLASGVLQYFDRSLPELLARLSRMPRHLILNKVATREGPPVFMLENFGRARVPYHVRNRAELEQSIAALGYRIVDCWHLPHLSHVIPCHREFGASTSLGYYATLG